jgi:hypothetical protein
LGFVDWFKFLRWGKGGNGRGRGRGRRGGRERRERKTENGKEDIHESARSLYGRERKERKLTLSWYMKPYSIEAAFSFCNLKSLLPSESDRRKERKRKRLTAFGLMQYLLLWTNFKASSKFHCSTCITYPTTTDGPREMPPLQWTKTVPPCERAPLMKEKTLEKERKGRKLCVSWEYTKAGEAKVETKGEGGRRGEAS